MKIKSWKFVLKGIAIAQAIAAPALMVVGTITNNKAVKTAGMVWCGLIALDTGRTVAITIDALMPVEEYDDDEEVIF